MVSNASNLLDSAKKYLKEAQSDGRIDDAISIAFEENIQAMVVEKFKRFIDGQDAPILKWANFEDQRIRGAFVQDSNTILISTNTASDRALITNVVLEEIGHWLESDTRGDSKNDEGAQFSSLLLNNKYITTEKSDSTRLSINGIEYKAELSYDDGKITIDEDSEATPLNLNIENLLDSLQTLNQIL